MFFTVRLYIAIIYRVSHKKTIIKKRLEIVFDLRQKFETFIRPSTISSVDVYGHRQQDIFEVLFRVGLKIYTVCSTGHDIELRLKIFWTCDNVHFIMFIGSSWTPCRVTTCILSCDICVEGILHWHTYLQGWGEGRKGCNPIPVFSGLFTFQIIFRNKTLDIMSTMRTRKLQNECRLWSFFAFQLFRFLCL